LTRTMKAYRLVEWGRPPEFCDVLAPEPGIGEVLIQVVGAGLCRTDLELIDQRVGQEPFAARIPAGFTLGHETAGLVAALGPGVEGLTEGDMVAVHHLSACGICDFCLLGIQQGCEAFIGGGGILSRGIGIDGGLAEYLVVPRHQLVRTSLRDPLQVAPLTDAAVTAYRATASVQDRLRPGSTALIIGLGGLGSYGVQLVRLLTPARVIAVDISPPRVEAAFRWGAHSAFTVDDDLTEQIEEVTAGRGVDAVIDFVGSDASLTLAARSVRQQARIVVVGGGGGTLPFGPGVLAPNCSLMFSSASNLSDLAAVCRLAEEGQLIIETEPFPFDKIPVAYEKLRSGSLEGRAVIRTP
jgi:alcohol dehydrogenase, propanol-preferring